MANKSTTIKNATDKELDELITRLRRETELQRLIYELKRGSSDQYNRTSYEYPEVSTEKPIEDLYHFGIPGMRWGKRKGKASADDDEANKSADSKRKDELKKRKLSSLSNNELKELNTRLGLEKQYKELNKVEISKGKKIFNDLIGNNLKTYALDYNKKYQKELLDSILKKTKESGKEKVKEEAMKTAARKAYEEGAKKAGKYALSTLR